MTSRIMPHAGPRCLIFLLFTALLFLSAGPDYAEDDWQMVAPGSGELKKLSTFLSNFTELSLYNADTAESGDPGVLHLKSARGQKNLIAFGIRHNFINNFKSRIRECTTPGCPYGDSTIDAKYVRASVKKYFGLTVQDSSIDDDFIREDMKAGDHNGILMAAHFDGTRYHFPAADGEATYYARVEKVFRNSGGQLLLTGYIYNSEDEKDRTGTFTAVVRPAGTDGKGGWHLVSLESRFRE